MTALRISDDENERFTFLMPSVALTGISLPDVEITPQKYLQYATLDLEEGTDRGAINALGSAKRALHLIVDSLLHAYGLLARNPRASFPKKLFSSRYGRKEEGRRSSTTRISRSGLHPRRP
jgi:hypothetical protein